VKQRIEGCSGDFAKAGIGYFTGPAGAIVGKERGWWNRESKKVVLLAWGLSSPFDFHFEQNKNQGGE
jgi:hypothetical protein